MRGMRGQLLTAGQIATASTPAKLEIAKSKGATHGVLSSEQGLDRKASIFRVGKKIN